MRGNILGVHNGRGVIGLDDGRRLEFSLAEWRSEGAPQPGQGVDFVEENGEARAVFWTPPPAAPSAAPNIVPVPPQAPPPTPTPLVATTAPESSTSFTLGIIGLCCLALGFIIPVLPTAVAFVVGVVGASQARRDRDNTGLILSRISWIAALVLLLLATLAIVVAFVFMSQFSLAAILRQL